MPDSGNSTYGPYVAGNQDNRDFKVEEASKYDWLRNVPYFAPGPHKWANDFHVGWKDEGATSSTKYPPRVFTLELEDAIRNDLLFWFSLGHQLYAEMGDLELFLEPDPLYYERQGRDFVREINASQNPPSIASSGEEFLSIQTERGEGPHGWKDRMMFTSGR